MSGSLTVDSWTGGSGMVGTVGSPRFGSSGSGITGSGEGVATGSEKTGSMLVVLVILSIAFCRSLSTD